MNEIIPTKLKIFIIPHPPDYYFPYSCPRSELSCFQGISQLNDIEITDNPELAHFYLLNYVPHIGQDKYNKSFIQPYLDPTKLIVYDNQDENESYLVNENEYLVYFKRSWFDLQGQLKERPANMFPTTYTILDQYLSYPIMKHKDRLVDIGVFLRPDSPNRSIILNLFSQVQQANRQLNIHVGPVSNGNRSSGDKVSFDNDYFAALGQTKINIHCSPPWIGDSRFHESISQVCCTFTNTRFDHLPNPYLHDQHIVQYNMNNLEDLMNKVNYYISNPHLVSQVAWAGYLHGLNHWQSKNIMEYVLNTAKRIKNEDNNKE